jgi:hypothetical protein
MQVEAGNRIRFVRDFLPRRLRIGAILKRRRVHINFALDAMNHQSQEIPGSTWREGNHGKIIFRHLHIGRYTISKDSLFFIRISAQDVMVGA